MDFEAFFAALPGAHMVLDRALCYVAASDTYCRIVSRTREELLGRNLFEIFPNDGPGGKKLKASFEKVLETGTPDTIPYIPYDLARPAAQGGGFEVRYWTATHMPVTNGGGEVTHVIQHTTDVTELVNLRAGSVLPFRVRASETDLLARAREAERENDEILAESEAFRNLFDQAPSLIAVTSGPQHMFTFANQAYLKIVGGIDVIGKTVAEVLPEAAEQGFTGLLDQVYQTGQRFEGQGVPISLTMPGDDEPTLYYLDFAYDAIRDSQGNVTGIFVQGFDTTESTRFRQRQALLVDEVNHRVKNTLAAVQSIAAQTFRKGSDIGTAKNAFDARLSALSNTHDMLSQREWSDAELHALIDMEFSVHGAERVDLSGPRVLLSPKASIAFTLLLHEMATNAAKYGALSADGGRVLLWWRLVRTEDGEHLDITWQERGGPAVRAPAKTGFGTRLIRTIVAGELDGALEIAYEPEGLRARFTVPEHGYLAEGIKIEAS